MPYAIPDSTQRQRYRLATEADRGEHHVDLAEAMRAFADDVLESGDTRLALERAFRWGYHDADGEHVAGLQEQLQDLRFQRDRLMRQIDDERFLDALKSELDRIDEMAGQDSEDGSASLDRLADRLERGYEDPDAQEEFDGLVSDLRAMVGHSSLEQNERSGHSGDGQSFFDAPSGSRQARLDRVRRMLFTGGAEAADQASGAWRQTADEQRAGAAPDMMVLVEFDRIEEALRALGTIGSVAELPEADLDALLESLPDDTATWLAEWSAAASELSNKDASRSASTLPPHVTAAIGRDLLKGLFSRISSPIAGEHQSSTRGNAGDAAEDSVPWEPGRPIDLSLIGTLTNAIRREGPRAGGRVRLHPNDFLIHERTARTVVSTVLAIDRSRSMGQSGAWTAAKKVTLAIHELIQQSYPRDVLSVVAFSSSAEVVNVDALPEMQWDRFEHGTHLQDSLKIGRRLLRGSPAGTRQIVVITDGEPTIAAVGGEEAFASPPTTEILEATMREVIRCTREGIVINVVLLGGDGAVASFAEQVAKVNGGRVFVASNQELGTYILRDYISC